MECSHGDGFQLPPASPLRCFCHLARATEIAAEVGRELGVLVTISNRQAALGGNGDEIDELAFVSAGRDCY